MDHAAGDVMNEFKDIVLAFGESDEYSFLFPRSTTVHKRRHAKILSMIASTFTSSYVFHWSDHLPEIQLKYPPTFDARVIVYPSAQEIRDYFSWRQADTHVNNLYNTVFWALVQQGGETTTQAHQTLKGTASKQKHEILFSQFAINYNDIPPHHRKGSVLCREKTSDDLGAHAVASSKGLTPIAILHCDIIKDDFWNARPDTSRTMLSLRLLLHKLNPFATSSRHFAPSASESTIFTELKPRHQPRYSRACCFGRRLSKPKDDSEMDTHRIDLTLYEETISTLDVDDFDETGASTLIDIRPLSEKGFAKVSGSKLTWHGETAHSLDEWHHLNSVSPYVPLSPISLWEDTDVDLEDEESYDWFGETPPVILTTGSNSIFLRYVLPGLKVIAGSRHASPAAASPAVGLIQRVCAWFGR
ncbi:hypothetical protein EUX98_g999 [Antrodiella citrinella]|uniref:tRNA(His) guanylyltransferase n=1 Tax=Antrodiella citrinella TaxID=2447956 RepID=A0A4S4NBA9_9APHY|nr:hypothetical protein EUX98_g999 [Antrodiella citrinella]